MAAATGSAQPAAPAAAAPLARLGVIGVGALAGAMLRALHRAWPQLPLLVSPRSHAMVAALQAEGLALQVLPDNQAVADACDTLLIGLRPAQLPALAHGLHLRAGQHLLLPSAGTPHAALAAAFAPARVTRLMCGLAVAGGAGAVCCHPPDATLQALWQPACASFLPLAEEPQFEGATLALCANAWWLDQLGALAGWLCESTGMARPEAEALLAGNMADVAQLLALHPGQGAAALARAIGTPGTYTAAGLDQLLARQAHQPWLDALAAVWQRMHRPGAA